MDLFKRKNRFQLLCHVVMVLMVIVVVVPFWILLAASFTDENWATTNGFSIWPGKWSTLAYEYVFMRWRTFGKAYVITISTTVVGVLIHLIVTAPCAYMLSKKYLPGKVIINFLLIFSMLFSGGLVATYLNYTQIFQIKNTYAAYIVPGMITNAFTIFMVRSYFSSSIPEELYESARIDGASELKAFVRIALPLAKPILATIALMQAIGCWNNWQNGAYYISDYGMWGIMNVLNSINNSISYLAQMAGSGAQVPMTTMRLAIGVIGILPLMIAYPFFQKYFVKGITMGAVKG